MSTKISRFRSDTARSSFLTAYDNALAAWPAPPTQLDVETRYGTTHVHSCGSSDGTAIVLLHAVAVSSPAWYANVGALGQHHSVYAVDTITDAGRSAQTEPISDGEAMAAWLNDVLTGLDVTSAHLVGLSFGAWLALNQAWRAPERLASVTAVDPPGAIARMKFNVKMVPDALLAAIAKSDPAIHRLLRRLNNGTLPAEPMVNLAIAGLRTFRLKQPFPKRLTDEQLQSITTPTLLLLGERSPVTDADRAIDRACRLITNVQAEIVPDSGHTPPMEHPELFNRRLLRFVNDVDQGA